MSRWREVRRAARRRPHRPSRLGWPRRGNRRRVSAVRIRSRALIALVGAAVLLVGLGLLLRSGYRAWQAYAAEQSQSVAAAPPVQIELDDALLAPPADRAGFEAARALEGRFDPTAPARLARNADFGAQGGGTLRVEYSLEEALTEEVFEILRRGRVGSGHALVIDPRSGRLLVYASTDPDGFPATAAYPSASIVKVLAAAALLEADDEGADVSCLYRGNKYRVNRKRLDRPSRGHSSDLTQALATSNNQCFSQWAVHVLGEDRLRSTFERFGWLSPPAWGHAPGRIESVESRLDLGRLGSGLDGLRVTPLHVAALTTVLTDGVLREPWWVDRVVDGAGRSLALPPRGEPRRVISTAHASVLREMMIDTTTRGTAKRAFRTRRGRPLLRGIDVAGKTGNLTGNDPFGRYEWFVGLAPAEAPRLGVVVLQLQGNLWWKKSSELAAEILREAFCDRSRCEAEIANRWTGDLGREGEPIRLSAIEAPLEWSVTTGRTDSMKR